MTRNNGHLHRRLLGGLANDQPGATLLQPGQQTFDLIEAVHLAHDRADALEATVAAQAAIIAEHGRTIAAMQAAAAASKA